MNLTSFLLEVPTQIIPGSGEGAADVAAGAGEAAASGGGLFASNNPIMIIVIYCVALFVIMYFFSIKPNRKRERELSERRNAITIGDAVVTNHGFFGKVVDTTYDCFIIEFGTNKSVRIPVAKSEVLGKREPIMTNEAPPALETAAPKKKGLFSRAPKDEE